MRLAADFLQHTNGLILIDIVGNERVGFFTIDRTLYDGTKESGRNQWQAVLRDPMAFGIKVIVMRLPAPTFPQDLVYGALYGTKELKQNYQLAYRSPSYLIYEVRTH